MQNKLLLVIRTIKWDAKRWLVKSEFSCVFIEDLIWRTKHWLRISLIWCRRIPNNIFERSIFIAGTSAHVFPGRIRRVQTIDCMITIFKSLIWDTSGQMHMKSKIISYKFDSGIQIFESRYSSCEFLKHFELLTKSFEFLSFCSLNNFHFASLLQTFAFLELQDILLIWWNCINGIGRFSINYGSWAAIHFSESIFVNLMIKFSKILETTKENKIDEITTN